jgi:hypothetical protein
VVFPSILEAQQLDDGLFLCNCNPCSKKDDTLLYEKSYKIIVGSATEMNQRLSYLTVDGFPGANSKSYYDRGIDCHRLVGLLQYLQNEGRD